MGVCLFGAPEHSIIEPFTSLRVTVLLEFQENNTEVRKIFDEARFLVIQSNFLKSQGLRTNFFALNWKHFMTKLYV